MISAVIASPVRYLCHLPCVDCKIWFSTLIFYLPSPDKNEMFREHVAFYIVTPGPAF